MSRVAIYDTTLRDGSQGEGISFSLEDKLQIARKLDELGFDFIEGGYPLSNPKDAEFFLEARELKLNHARMVAFGMTRRANSRAESDTGLNALLAAETPVVTIVGKSWDLHVRDVLGTTRDENLRMIADSIALCRAAGREVVYDAEHFFDGFRADPDFAMETLRAAEQAGACVLALCDTNGGSLPGFVAKTVSAVRAAVRLPIGIHCHNDSELAVANSLAAVECGASQVQGTINGIGERCGNVDLISVVANLVLKCGTTALQPDSLARLTELSRYVYELANMNFRSAQAFVGSSAFAHKGGMHTHAVGKVRSSYEHINPESVGNARRILVSELSGQSTVLAKTTKYQISHNRELMGRIIQRVQDLEYAGYEFEAAEGSFDILVKKAIGTYRPFFEPVAYRVNIEADRPAESPVTEATIKVRVGGRLVHTVAEGDGPVNALDAALRKALCQAYPRLSELRFLDYKVRIVNSREGSAARVRVVIESRDSESAWGTVGVSENVIEASWLALIDSIEYKLFRDFDQAEASEYGPDSRPLAAEFP